MIRRYHLANYLLSLILIAVPVFAVGQNYFTPVAPTGLPYHIIINQNTVYNTYSASQVEIGVFDGDLCVGSGSGTINSSQTIDIVAWEGNPDYSLEGFTAGDSITIKLAVIEFGSINILPASVDYAVGDGTFGYGSYSAGSVTGTISNVPDIEVTPSALNFGALNLGNTQFAFFKVKNTGSADLQVSNITAPSGYGLGSTSMTLAPGDSQSVQVAFTPTNPVAYNGNIQVYSNDPSQVPETIAVTGLGIPDQVPQIDVAPHSLSFGQIPIGQSESRNLTLSNQGSSNLSISGIMSNNSVFQVDNTSQVLAPGEELIVSITFSPSSDGSVTGSIHIYHNDNSISNPYSVGVNGIGYNQYITPVEETGLPYTIIINDVTVDDQALTSGSEIGVFDDVLCVGSAVYSGSYPVQITAWEADADKNLPGFVDGDSIVFKVRTTAYDSTDIFTAEPTFSIGDGVFGSGAYTSASLTVVSNLEPRLILADANLEFSLTTVGGQDTLYTNLKNTGATSLTVYSISLDNNVFTANPTTGVIAAGDSLPIQIIFTPQAGVWYNGSLTVNCDDPLDNSRTINLSGGGVLSGEPTIHVPVASWSVGDVIISDTGSVAISVFNTGNATLNVSDIVSSTTSFVPQITSLSIEMNSSAVIPVNFYPDSVGWFNGNLTITSDASNEAEVIVTLTGFGYAGHFEPVAPTGEQYQVVVSSIVDSSGYGLSEGDEIGLFDGLQCVGVSVYHGTDSLNISAWQAIPDQGIPGYSEGNLIQFKYYLKDSTGAGHVFDVLPIYQIGNGSYGHGIFSEATLNVLNANTPFEPYDGPIYHISNATGRDYLNNGNMDQPFASIQHGINVAKSGDTLLVQPGTYYENINFNGKDIVLGSLYLTTADTSYTSQTVIDGNKNGSVVTFDGDEDSMTVMVGFTLTNGLSANGGGLYINSSSPTLSELKIHENEADIGGGVYFSRSLSRISQIVVSGNTASMFGGGISLQLSNVRLEDSRISNNSSVAQGGGVYSSSSESSYENVVISNNSGSAGGGIFCYTSSPTFNEVTFEYNSAINNGGGIYLGHKSCPTFINALIVSNVNRGGIYCHGQSEPILVNSTISDNAGSGIVCLYSDITISNSIISNNSGNGVEASDSSPSIMYSNLYNNTGNSFGNSDSIGVLVTTNINGDSCDIYQNTLMDPMFVSATSNDHHLLDSSPCINSGNPATIYSNEPEPNGDRVNMGAFGNTAEAAVAGLQLVCNDTIAVEDSSYFADLSLSPDSNVVFTYELVSGPDWIEFNDTTAQCSGIPDNSNVDTHQLLVAAADNYTRTDTLVANLTVINSPPIITSIPDTIATEDRLYNYDINSSDDGQGSIYYSALVIPDWMQLDSLTGELTGIPNDSDVGDTIVSVQVSDGNAGSAVQTFNLRIVNRNDAIQIVSQPDTITYEDRTYTYDVETLDDDLNDRALFTLLTAPDGMLIDSLSGVISWLPDNNDVGDTTIVFMVIDDSAAADTQSYRLQVINVNDQPVISSTADTVAVEGQLYDYSLIAYDVDVGDQLSYVLETAPVGMRWIDSTKTIEWRPHNENVGDTLVTITVTDDSGAVAEQSFTLTVANTNDPPTLVSPIPDLVVYEDALDSVFILTTVIADSDFTSIGDSMIYTLTNQNTELVDLSIVDDTLLIHFLANQYGSGGFVLSAQDQDSAVVSDTVDITVLPVNDAPDITSADSVRATEDIYFVYRGQATDIDNIQLSYTFVDVPTWLSADSDSLYGIPTEGIGDTSFVLVVSDSTIADSCTVNLFVDPVNDPPVLSAIPAIIFEEDSTHITAVADYNSYVLDPDDHDSTLIWSFVNSEYVSGHVSNDSVIVTSSPDWYGKDTIQVVVADTALYDTIDWEITVLSIEDNPRITTVADTIATEDRLYQYHVQAYDPDPGDSIIFNLSVHPVGMTIDTVSGLVSWSPQNADVGDTTVSIKVTDITNRLTYQTYTLQVINANDAIQIVSNPDTVAFEDSDYVYAVETLDDDLNDQALFTLTVAPQGMVIDSLSGRITWQPDNSDVGDTLVAFQVTDDSGAVDIQSYTLHVMNTNDAPEIISIPDTVAIEDSLYIYSVSALDVDVGDHLLFSLSSAPSGMTINDTSGVINWLPDNADVGDTTIMVVVTDDSSGVAEQTYVLRVENVNDPPVINIYINDFAVDEDSPDTMFALLQIFNDDDIVSVNDSLQFTYQNSNPELLNISIDQDTLLLDYILNQNGEASISVTAEDQENATATEWFEVTINSVNDIPESFDLVTPNGIIFTDSLLEFTWKSSYDPDIATDNDRLYYTFRYSSDPNFSIYSDIEDITDTTVVLNDDLVQDQLYYWKVRVEDMYREKVWSNQNHTFTLNYANNAPSLPIVFGPIDLSIADTSAIFTWSPCTDSDIGDTVAYSLQVSSSQAFSDTLLFHTTFDTLVSLVDLSYGSLVEDGLHWLRLRSVDNHGLASIWTDAVSFYYDNINAAPIATATLLEPVGEVVTVLRPDLEWRSGSDTDPGDAVASLSYAGVVWSVVDTFAFSTLAGDTTYQLASDVTENQYYQWSVRTVDDGGLISGWSDTVSFWVNSVNEPPGIFSLISPGNDTLATSYPTFSWHGAVDPDVGSVLTYSLRYGTDPGLSTYSEVEEIADTVYTLVDSLWDDIPYYWRVKVKDEFGLSTWSTDTLSFVVNAVNAAPTLPELTGLVSYMVLDTTAVWQWLSSQDADVGDCVSYELQVSSSQAFSDTLLFHTTFDTLVSLVDLSYGSLVEDGLHWLRLRSVDNHGLASIWTDAVSFYYDNINAAPIATATLLEPVGEVVTVLRPDLEWRSGSDTDPGDAVASLSYAGVVWSVVDTFAFSTLAGDTTYQLASDVTENQYYQWSVRTVDDGGLISGWSDTVSFWVNSVNEPPGIFSLIAPVDADTIDTYTPTCVWGSSTDLDPGDSINYVLRTSNSSDFNQYSDRLPQADTVFTFSDSLLEDHWKYWQVRAVDLSGLSQWSEIHSFYVNAVPNIPPVAVWTYQDTILSGITQVPYFAVDPDSESVTILIEYSINSGGNWLIPTEDISRTEIEMRDNSIFNWDTEADLPDWYGSILLRVIPEDDETTGIGDTITLIVDNIPPSLSLSPIATEQSGDVGISYLAQNDLYSPTSITLYYRTSSDENWVYISIDHLDPAPNFQNNSEQTIYWNSALDLPGFVGDEVQVKVTIADYSSEASQSSNTFSLNNNVDPQISIAPLIGWKHDLIPIVLEYYDLEEDFLTFSIFYSVDGDHYLPITCDLDRNQAIENDEIPQNLLKTSDEEFEVKSPINYDGFNSTSDISSNGPSIDNIVSMDSMTPAIQALPNDTTFIWDSQLDLDSQFAGTVWLMASVCDPYSPDICDTIQCQVDNYLPQITINPMPSEVSGTVRIYISIDNDSAHSVNIYGDYKRYGFSNWNQMSFDGFVNSGVSTAHFDWNTFTDLGDSTDQILDLRLFAQDDLDRGDYRYIQSLIVDNNDIPVIDSVVLVSQDPRGDVRFHVYISDRETDNLNFQCSYSLNNGSYYLPTTDFRWEGHYAIGGMQTFIWESFENIINGYFSNVKFKIEPLDNDLGIENTSPTFILNNIAGPKLESVLNDQYPNLLWQDTIKLLFNRSISTNSISSGIEILTDGEHCSYSWEASQNNQLLKLFPQTAYYPEKPVEVTITHELVDYYNHSFDGNQNHVPDGADDDVTINFTTPALADYDFNGILNEYDLLDFITNWNLPTPDLTMEIGPATGLLPYNSFTPDGYFDYEDLMVFIATWKWAMNNISYAKLSTPYDNTNYMEDLVEQDITVEIIDDRLEVVVEYFTNIDVSLIKYNITGTDSIISNTFEYWENNYSDQMLLENNTYTFVGGLGKNEVIDENSGKPILSIKTFVEDDVTISSSIMGWNQNKELAFNCYTEIPIDIDDYIPATYALHTNYPNPFNPITTINYDLPQAGHVKLIVYDILGRQVIELVNDKQDVGYKTIQWNGRNSARQIVSAGMYFYSLEVGDYHAIRKMVLIK